ncbi:hypothetical protein HW532_19085 [Kaustia mangrovi]|uniref:Uncharacterized protein n=1 Tax=Kaustia mangrovi TaxID=2593653 RepID=A0A7S8C740_9HYPH|nr:hypothetical protein [Kaustia mangrovi]QPC44621.1 hypothetical protein HW532_19085 [Kaustia mangrovi]
MTRRKGEITRSQIDRGYPYQVEIVIPPNGLGRKIDDIYTFLRERGYAFKKRGGRDRRTEGIFHTSRYCFTSMEHAQAFQDRFGCLYSGEIVVVERKR